MIEFAHEFENTATIKVVGVGGGGCNAVNRMIESDLRGVEFLVTNTDAQALRTTKALQKIQIGSRLTKGLGAGADPKIGRLAAEEDRDTLLRNLEGADMVFITCGLGGGTGTGGAPVIADIVRETGALSVAVVTKPFNFEGRRRKRQADEGLEELTDKVDTLIVIPNEKLLTICEPDTSLVDAFGMADDVLVQAVRGISDLITVEGLINVDFADVRTVMSEAGGNAIMGTGIGNGEECAVEAAQGVISCPLLDGLTIHGARGILVNITGGPGITLKDVNEAASVIHDVADEDANIIFGAVIDEKLNGEMRITVIATGFDGDNGRVGVIPEVNDSISNPIPVDNPTIEEKKAPGTLFDNDLKPPDDNSKEIDLSAVYLGDDAAESEFDIPTFIRMRSKKEVVKN